MTFLERKIAVSESCVVREMEGGFVILNLDTERFYELTEVGKRFWELLAEQQEYEVALNVLQNEYEVSTDQLQADITRLLEDLIRAKLIVSC